MILSRHRRDRCAHVGPASPRRFTAVAGVLLSLGETHSFPLETVWQFLNSARVEQVLSQAVLGAPVFQPHFRHVATRALQIPRMRSGKKLPPPIVRILTEDLLAAVFPNAAACPENLPGGDIEIPDHPLIVETLKECLREIMDLDGLRQLLLQIEAGAVTVLACDTAEPSPLAHHLLAAAEWEPHWTLNPQEVGTEVDQALKQLPEAFRLAVLLVDVEELSYEEAAAVLNCPVGTVRSRLFRARKLLFMELQPYALKKGYAQKAKQ